MAYKLEVIKSVYFFSTFNEKACNSLTQDMTFNSHRYGEVILPFDKAVTKLYIVKQGSVRLQRLRLKNDEEIETEAMIKNIEQSVDIKGMKYLANEFRKETDFEDFCQRGQWQTFGEEYFYKRVPSEYRAVVSSAECMVVTIPFHLIANTLSTFEMYCDIMRTKITEKTGGLTCWRDDIDQRMKVKDLAKPTAKKSSMNLEKKLLNKPKLPSKAINKLLQ